MKKTVLFAAAALTAFALTACGSTETTTETTAAVETTAAAEETTAAGETAAAEETTEAETTAETTAICGKSLNRGLISLRKRRIRWTGKENGNG